ncbi:MAG TPA: PAS domain-containing protein, partial [Pseudoduganella sp.]
MDNKDHHKPAAELAGGGPFPENEPARTLSEYEASAASRRLALVSIALSAGMFMALLPFAAVPLGVANWFIPLYQPVVAVNDLITATLLFGYLRLTRKYALLVLACGYLYSAIMAVVHLLTFPGVFAPQGLLGAGAQTTGYLHVFWHCGLPVAVIVYAKLKQGDVVLQNFALDTAKAVFVTLACAAALALLATLGHALLPPMLADSRYAAAFNVGRYGQWALTAAALAYLYTRRSSSTLDLWLLVVLVAWFFEISLVSIFNAGRWDVGFYAGRGYALIANSFVLVMLLVEHVNMYRDLAEAQSTARVARKLAETREVLRLALVAGRMGVFSWDLRNNRAWWSQELEHMVGMAPGSLPAEPDAFMQRIFAEDHAAISAALRECIRNRHECDVEFRMKDGDGELLWAFARAEAEYDAQGRAATVFGIIGDITARKRSEAVAAELEAQFQTMANEIPQIAWMSHPDGWIYWFNRRLYEYTGLSLEQVQGWSWEQAIEPTTLRAVLQQWRRSLATGNPFEMVLQIRGADGVYRPFLTRAVPMKNPEGRIIHWFGTNTDITAQSEAEQALKRADQRKDEFIATLAHELRNPLAPIRSATELLNRFTQLAPNVERAIAVIDRQSRHLARLVEDLLEVSRITQGKVSLQRKTVSLVDCLSDALHAVDNALKAAG